MVGIARQRAFGALGCAAALIWAAAAWAADSTPRAVLGTLQVYRTVEVANGEGGWRSVPTGAPLVDGTRVRTGGESAAYLSFGKAGIVGLYPGGEVAVRSLGSGRAGIEVTRGSIIFRIDPAGGPELRTPAFTALAASGTPGSESARELVQGTLSVAADGRCTIEGQRGELLLRSASGGPPLVVHSGQRLDLAADGQPVFRRVQAVGPEVEGGEKEDRGRLAGWLEWIMTHPLWAGAIGVAAVGGAAGGIAAAVSGGGGGGGGGGRGGLGRGGEGSPFRP